MDEPASALDPIATAIIEELIDELRANYTIVIVTHSMQQAARVSQRTAFFHLGKLIEHGHDRGHLLQPAREADRGLHHRQDRLSRALRSSSRPAEQRFGEPAPASRLTHRIGPTQFEWGEGYGQSCRGLRARPYAVGP